MKKMSQVELSRTLNFTPSYISALCSNDDMTCSKLAEICRLININPAIFFNDIPLSQYTLEDITAGDGINLPEVQLPQQSSLQYSEELIKAHERTIDILTRQIDILNGTIQALTSSKSTDA
ncbi:MAG: helix-turn-helix domain-containing protein [Muribaculaceae bacterium]|nr:helix-turn-helix domain-containing protein [Muribaculaceae bacterium]